MCEHALRGQVAFWKVPRFCCGTSTRIRIDWTGLASRLLLKLLEILGHAKATMPRRQPDLNQKSVCRKNQNRGKDAGPWGVPGAPCPACNATNDGAAPRMPEGFKTEVDNDGWRQRTAAGSARAIRTGLGRASTPGLPVRRSWCCALPGLQRDQPQRCAVDAGWL
jgi:hypothetical protein